MDANYATPTSAHISRFHRRPPVGSGPGAESGFVGADKENESPLKQVLGVFGPGSRRRSRTRSGPGFNIWNDKEDSNVLKYGVVGLGGMDKSPQTITTTHGYRAGTLSIPRDLETMASPARRRVKAQNPRSSPRIESLPNVAPLKAIQYPRLSANCPSTPTKDDSDMASQLAHPPSYREYTPSPGLRSKSKFVVKGGVNGAVQAANTKNTPNMLARTSSTDLDEADTEIDVEEIDNGSLRARERSREVSTSDQQLIEIPAENVAFSSFRRS